MGSVSHSQEQQQLPNDQEKDQEHGQEHTLPLHQEQVEVVGHDRVSPTVMDGLMDVVGDSSDIADDDAGPVAKRQRMDEVAAAAAAAALAAQNLKKVHNEQWNEMLERLKAYRAQNGDCLVPKRFPADPKVCFCCISIVTSLDAFQLTDPPNLRYGILIYIAWCVQDCVIICKRKFCPLTLAISCLYHVSLSSLVISHWYYDFKYSTILLYSGFWIVDPDSLNDTSHTTYTISCILYHMFLLIYNLNIFS